MIKPLPPHRSELIRLCARLGIEIGYAPERWHSTLLPLGESSRSTIDAVHRALEQFEGDPFMIAFDRVEGDTLKPRKGQRAPGFFQRTIATRIATAGIPLPPYRFSLHLNLNYGGTSRRRIAIPPITWQVSEILLIESGSGRHIDRGRWPLEHRQLPLGF